jgi:hypothetical protein
MGPSPDLPLGIWIPAVPVIPAYIRACLQYPDGHTHTYTVGFLAIGGARLRGQGRIDTTVKQRHDSGAPMALFLRPLPAKHQHR